MDAICLNDIKTLIQRDGGAHVSIYMPTHHRGGVDPQDPIRLRNLLRLAEEKLVARGLRPAEARSLIAPAEKLLTDNLFWRQQSEGLAVFLETNMFLYYRVPVKLNEEVGVSERYYIKPLVPLLSYCGWFYVLALSRHENRLLQCTAYGSVRRELTGVPKSMAEALHEEVPDARIQYHASSQVSGSNFGTSSAIQTGIGSTPNYEKREVLQYFDQVNTGIAKVLANEKAPLILAAVDSLHPLYRKANTYQNLLPEGILGNPDGVSDETLREQAWKIVKPYFDKSQTDAVADFNKTAGTGLTVTGIQDTLTAANGGRVRFLFIADGIQQRGSFDPENNIIKVQTSAEPGDEDLMDLVAYQTLTHAGTIFVMKPEEVPGGAPVTAILRY